jgi:uncharacterized protein (DUF2236 family)
MMKPYYYHNQRISSVSIGRFVRNDTVKLCVWRWGHRLALSLAVLAGLCTFLSLSRTHIHVPTVVQSFIHSATLGIDIPGIQYSMKGVRKSAIIVSLPPYPRRLQSWAPLPNTHAMVAALGVFAVIWWLWNSCYVMLILLSHNVGQPKTVSTSKHEGHLCEQAKPHERATAVANDRADRMVAAARMIVEEPDQSNDSKSEESLDAQSPRNRKLPTQLRRRRRSSADIDQHSADDHVAPVEFQRSLECVQEDLRKSNHTNLYGECDSINYVIGRESISFLASGRAALLQMAHPFVAVAVEEHSSLLTNVQQRFYRTFEYMFTMAFGDGAQIVRAARFVRSLHNKVHGTFNETVGPFRKGDRYHAHQPHALLWVAATLIDSSSLLFEMFVRPLQMHEKTAALRNSQRLYDLFGIPADIAPETWQDFEAYNHAMWNSDVLTVGTSAMRLKDFIFRPPTLIFYPMLKFIEISTAVTLPPRLRKQFGMRVNWFDTLMVVLVFGMIRCVYICIPPSVRYVTDYLRMERRRGIHRPQWPTR